MPLYQINVNTCTGIIFPRIRYTYGALPSLFHFPQFRLICTLRILETDPSIITYPVYVYQDQTENMILADYADEYCMERECGIDPDCMRRGDVRLAYRWWFMQTIAAYSSAASSVFHITSISCSFQMRAIYRHRFHRNIIIIRYNR